MLVSATQIGLAVECSLAAPAKCASTYELRENPGFFRNLARFVGPGKSSYVYRNTGNADQVMGVLMGPHDDRQDIDGGSYLFTSCRPFNCDEKGAVIVGPDGIEAGSVLRMNCLIRNTDDCPFRQTLTTFVRHPLSKPSAAALKKWVHATTDPSEPAGTIMVKWLRLIPTPVVSDTCRMRLGSAHRYASRLDRQSPSETNLIK